ncbi:MAG: hypothetical protein ACD_79C00642G0002 [uncultured bacterium]|nr:MAG: hypothetical protein ACD_79C00642G0002 [uncultured bacterium]
MKNHKSTSYEEGLMERLKSPEYAANYLKASLDDGIDNFLNALRDVAKAYSFSHVAKKTKLGRESLYKALSKKGNPSISTLNNVLHSVGLKLSVESK